MPHESEKPQRIPKRPIREGRAAESERVEPVSEAVTSSQSSAEPKPQVKPTARSTPSAKQRPSSRVADQRSAQKRNATKITRVPKLQTNDTPLDVGLWTRFRSWMKTAPALSFSLILHLIAFLGLGAMTFVTWEPEKELLITASAVEASEAPIEELTEIDMGELEEFEEETFETDAADVVLDDVSIDAPVAEVAPEVTGTAPPTGAAVNKGEKTDGKPKKKPGKKGAKTKAMFYGAPAQGNRFAFIVDNSNSMVNGKMLTTMDQLLRTINGLTAKQEFYVVFYSDAAYPMFYPAPESSWVKADKTNKSRLYEWLKTVELCSGGRLDLALEKTFELEPDSIFLVGDGSDVGKAEEKVIKEQTMERRYVVHTLCIGGNGVGAKKLKGIADYTGGTFRFVAPLPGFVEMSKTNKFKMNKTRGRVWGKNIGR